MSKSDRTIGPPIAPATAPKTGVESLTPSAFRPGKGMLVSFVTAIGRAAPIAMLTTACPIGSSSLVRPIAPFTAAEYAAPAPLYPPGPRIFPQRLGSAPSTLLTARSMYWAPRASIVPSSAFPTAGTMRSPAAPVRKPAPAPIAAPRSGCSGSRRAPVYPPIVADVSFGASANGAFTTEGPTDAARRAASRASPTPLPSMVAALSAAKPDPAGAARTEGSSNAAPIAAFFATASPTPPIQVFGFPLASSFRDCLYSPYMVSQRDGASGMWSSQYVLRSAYEGSCSMSFRSVSSRSRPSWVFSASSGLSSQCSISGP